MSILPQVLSSAVESEVININKVFPDITKNLNLQKNSAIKYLSDDSTEVEPDSSQDTLLLTECQQLSEKMMEMTATKALTRKEISTATEELSQLENNWKENQLMLAFCGELLKIHNSFNTFTMHMQSFKYLDASKEIRIVHNVLYNPTVEIENLDIYSAIYERLLISKQSLIEPVRNIWSSSLILVEAAATQSTSVKIITANLSQFQEALEILASISDTDLAVELKNFCSFLMDKILSPILEFECNVVSTSNDEEITLTITKTSSKQSNINCILQRLRTVFRYVDSYFNIKFDNTTLFQLIGIQISTPFCDQFIYKYVYNTIPTTPVEMREYGSIIDQISTFQQELIDFQFFKPDNSTIFDYANNVETLYANNLSKSYVERAGKIMKKDLHNTVEVGSDTDEIQQERGFKKCQVSNSVLELKELLQDLIALAVESSEMCSQRLVVTLKNIFALYPRIVPQYHKKLLETIPQQVALFYNNCYYLAVIHQEIRSKYIDKLPGKLKGSVMLSETELEPLISTANETFNAQLQTQKKQILDILNESGLVSLGQVSRLDTNTEKSIRQCLRQLELLQTVWRKVLPINIYNKSMGNLLNAFVEDLLRRVTVVEDISAAAATQVAAFYSLVQQRAPKVFSEPNEIYQHCSLWMKLSATIFVLEGNLAGIDERWADGKGPLAAEFTAEELKSLIRALFQNSDKRAAVLSNIK